jgi:hypothetical protein
MPLRRQTSFRPATPTNALWTVRRALAIIMTLFFFANEKATKNHCKPHFFSVKICKIPQKMLTLPRKSVRARYICGRRRGAFGLTPSAAGFRPMDLMETALANEHRTKIE